MRATSVTLPSAGETTPLRRDGAPGIAEEPEEEGARAGAEWPSPSGRVPEPENGGDCSQRQPVEVSVTHHEAFQYKACALHPDELRIAFHEEWAVVHPAPRMICRELPELSIEIRISREDQGALLNGRFGSSADWKR